MKKHTTRFYHRAQLFYFAVLAGLPGCTAATAPKEATYIDQAALAQRMQAGDIVFIRVPFYPFARIAEDTGSWTNHVGIVTAADSGNITISESTFPFSGQTSLKRFVARSENGRIAVSRLNTPITAQEASQLAQATQKRNGILYDSGFNLYSRRQFCSRYVRESVAEATGQQVGDITTFDSLLKDNPKANLTFWRFWYFGNIPWERKTVTPASMLHSPLLHSVFDGYALKA